MAERHEVLGGKVNVYRRENSKHWQCAAFVNGRNWRVSTRHDSLSHAKDFAEDWYLELRGKSRAGILKGGKRFKDAAEIFLAEYPVITEGQRSEKWTRGYELRLRAFIIPYLGNMYLAEIDDQTIQDYRLHRIQTFKNGKMPSRTTLHHDIIAIRQVLRTAKRRRWIQHLPDMSLPYKAAGKVTRRAWFSPEEYKKLYEATRDRITNPRHNRGRWVIEAENLHDYVLFMVNTGLRPDEASNIEVRDVTIVREGTKPRLDIDVRGKRGVGYCKSMPGAVLPFERTVKRKGLAKATDKVFGKPQRDLLNTILDETGLKFDRDGQRRTAYSLRHTYICLRLMEGADIYQLAKNCRTSVEMIQKYYANHIKDMIDAEAVNVQKRKPAAKKPAKRSA